MAVAILGGTVLAALGRAGEMAVFAGDLAPIDLDEVTATDIALLRPPMSLWGYNAQATEEALRVIARSVTERDVEIATLRRELADLRTGRDAGVPAAWDAGVPTGRDGGLPAARDAGPRAHTAGNSQAGNSQAGNSQAGNSQAGNSQAGNSQAGNSQAGEDDGGGGPILPAGPDPGPDE